MDLGAHTRSHRATSLCSAGSFTLHHRAVMAHPVPWRTERPNHCVPPRTTENISAWLARTFKYETGARGENASPLGPIVLQRVNYERQGWKCASAESARAAQATRRFAGSCAMGWGHTGVVVYESCADKQSPQMLFCEGDKQPLCPPLHHPRCAIAAGTG